MLLLRSRANAFDSASLSNALRARRFSIFETLTGDLPRPLRILDIGGTTAFWEQRHWAGRPDVHITTVNLKAEARKYDNIEPREGDATDLHEFADGSYDVTFSNSVIEHLFTFDKQARMAAEIQRVGRAHWVQTPNYWFPMEPHFHVVGWQWLPVWMRVAIIRRRTCGWRGRTIDPIRAREVVGEVRLMTRRELAGLFPDSKLMPERFYGFVKSWVVLAGFPRDSYDKVGLGR